MPTLIRRRPIASYFALVFLISWGGSILMGLGNFVRGAELELIDVLPMAIAMLSAPIFAGIVMTTLTDGRFGLSDLFTRMGKWRMDGRWYLTLLIFPVLILAVQIPLSLWLPELRPIFFPLGILMGLLAGFLEETGWMGFVYPQMRLRFSVLRASLYLGVIHGIWHAAADFLGNFHAFGVNWLPYFAAFVLFVVALRVIIVWVYEGTHSVLLAQLLHASSSGFLGVLVSRDNAAATWPIFYAVYAVALWLVAALVMTRHRSRMATLPTEEIGAT